MQTNDNVLFTGFIVTGSDPKKVLLRATGPSLKVGGTPVSGRLADPVIELYDGSGKLLETNDNWKDSPSRNEIESSGLAPTDDLESAIARVLDPGAYTAIIRGKNNGMGIGVIEAFDRNTSADSTFANVSGRGFVERGDNVLIAGVIVGNQQGGTKALVRALGPSLKPRLNDALNDPTLVLYDQNGAVLADNDNWRSASNAAEIEATGAAPTNDAESAILMQFPPALYTAIVRGKNDTVGIGVVDVYTVQ